MSTAHSPNTGDRQRCRRLALAVWRNPLARGTDRTEAAVVILMFSIWLLALPLAATAGSLYWQDVSALAADQLHTRTQTTATLTENAADFMYSASGNPISGQVLASARWVAPDGSERTGIINAAGGVGTGDAQQIWVDPKGHVTDAPLSGTAAAALLMLITAGAWLTLSVLLGAGWLTVRWRLNRRRLDTWDHEWQRIEPGWSGRHS
jgi:hypothetical protein